MCVWLLGYVQLLATPWTAAHQAPLSTGFFRQEYWSGSPFPPPGDLPNPGIQPMSSTLQVDSLLSSHHYIYFFVIVHAVFQNIVNINHFHTMIIINIRNVKKAWLFQPFDW